MRVIAHRGLWKNPDQQNSLLALSAALEAGFGIETDLWGLPPCGCVTHDPPTSDSFPTLQDVLALPHRPDSLLAINVKSDAVAPLLNGARTRLGQWEWFAFDMSIPETIRLESYGLPFLRRVSVHEPPPCSLQGMGLWIDGLGGETPIVNPRRGELHVYVSPELHSKPFEATWESLRRVDSDSTALCTDFPHEADRFFNHRSSSS